MFLNNRPQKSKKFNSHKYFHGKSCFAALCSEVGFLHIQKNLLGHFSKMDKEIVCPKIKNGPTSLSNVFNVGPTNSGTLSITSVIVDMHHRRKILGFIWDW
jgi:hypothetical protein